MTARHDVASLNASLAIPPCAAGAVLRPDFAPEDARRQSDTLWPAGVVPAANTREAALAVFCFDAPGEPSGQGVEAPLLEAMLRHARHSVRTTDAVARLDDSRIAILFMHVGLPEAAVAAERLRAILARATSPQGGAGLTVSCGLAPVRGGTFGMLIGEAGSAAEEARRRGGGRCICRHPPT